MANEKNYILATLDAETDPFVYYRIPEAFCWGLYTGKNYYEKWGDDSTDQIIELILSLPEKHLIYAHNGGKFDFMYLLKKGVLSDPIKIINGRIVSARIGIHEIRDSYAILPMPLAGYKKDEFDYELMEREVREDNKKDILHYLASDCENLYELVEGFINEFGLNLTIGSTSIKKIKEFHPFEIQNDTHDEIYRPYYFGGRVQCFDRGLKEGVYKSLDVNSMYPHVMANYQHPTGNEYTILYDTDIPESFYIDGILPGYEDKPYFIDFDGTNKNALPVRTPKGLDFECEAGNFKTLSHELKIGLEYNLIEIDSINEIRIPKETINFGLFVLTYIKDKIEAKRSGDKIKEILTKFLLNSGYGKFGQNPENFFDYHIRYPGEKCPDLDIWRLDIDYGFMELWKAPAPKPIYYDVAIAASITSAARSVLLEALCNATNPQYCDTDSIICESINNVEMDRFKLGAWDTEATGDQLYLAGKKLYALFDSGNPVKYASKGVRLTPDQIKKVSMGESINWKNEAPSFNISGEAKFINRTIKRR